MAQSYRKVQNVGKIVVPPGDRLQEIVLKTSKKISAIVGATLGPGGRSVILERQENGMSPIVTKDGVSVFKSLGFQDPIQQLILEAQRDAATKTAEIAGDGTTTATILSSAIIDNMASFLKVNPKISPQKVIREIGDLFKTVIRPLIEQEAIKVQYGIKEDNIFLHAVACVSANGDGDLADAVMNCFELVGDAGNVTISEVNGRSEYVVETIEGMPVTSGFEDSCGRFFSVFLNDKNNNRILLENTLFVLYHGKLD